jgi:amidase
LTDTALFLDAVSDGADGGGFARAAASPPGRLRIAFSRRIPPGVIAGLDADCARAVDDTVEALRSLGHELDERDPEYGVDGFASVLPRYLRGIHDDARSMPHPERLERRTRGMARLGGLVPEAMLERSLAGESRLAERLNGVLTEPEHDVLLTPATAAPPPRIGQLQGRGALWTLNAVAGMVPYNGVWNVTGQPAASVPAGLGGDGLPRGVQLVVRPHAEATLLSLAAQLQAEHAWTDARPPGFA